MRVHNAGLDGPFWALAEADSGHTLRPLAEEDLRVLLDVSLPAEWRDRGQSSGERLGALRLSAPAAAQRRRKREAVTGRRRAVHPHRSGCTLSFCLRR